MDTTRFVKVKMNFSKLYKEAKRFTEVKTESLKFN